MSSRRPLRPVWMLHDPDEVVRTQVSTMEVRADDPSTCRLRVDSCQASRHAILSIISMTCRIDSHQRIPGQLIEGLILPLCHLSVCQVGHFYRALKRATKNFVKLFCCSSSAARKRTDDKRQTGAIKQIDFLGTCNATNFPIAKDANPWHVESLTKGRPNWRISTTKR